MASDTPGGSAPPAAVGRGSKKSTALNGPTALEVTVSDGFSAGGTRVQKRPGHSSNSPPNGLGDGVEAAPVYGRCCLLSVRTRQAERGTELKGGGDRESSPLNRRRLFNIRFQSAKPVRMALARLSLLYRRRDHRQAAELVQRRPCVYGHFGNGPPLKETRRCGVARRFCAIVSQALGPSFRRPKRLTQLSTTCIQRVLSS